MKYIINLCAIYHLTFGNCLAYSPYSPYSPNPPQYIPIAGHGNIFPSDPNDDADENNYISMPEQMIIHQSERLCLNKECCRAPDDIYSEYLVQTTCTNKGYLECLAATNNCVWDCNPSPTNTYRAFRGINQRQGVEVQPLFDFELFDNDNEAQLNDPIPGYYTMDECATMYSFNSMNYLNNIQNPVDEQLTTEEGDMNENNQRRLYAVFSPDGRENVTLLTHFPYYKNVFISIWDTSGSRYRCSGALISPIHVLTAAHCLSDGNGNLFRSVGVYSGVGMSYYGIKLIDNHPVRGIFLFEEYHLTKDLNYNIAIITLDINETGYGWYSFGYNENIAASWQFDFSGYAADNGEILQRQNLYMDYTPNGIQEHVMLTRSGDITPYDAGGPLWYTGDIKPKIYGIASHFRKIGSITVGNAFVRITPGKMSAMCKYIMTFPQTNNHCTITPVAV